MKTHPLLASVLAFTCLPATAQLIGTDSFDYVNGVVAGQTGGTGWDKNQDSGTNTGTPSNWDDVFGATTVAGNAAITNDSGAKREFNGGDENTGAVKANGRVFFKTTMTRAAGASWGGISSYDFNTERIFFGVTGAGGATDTVGIATQNIGGGELPEGAEKLSGITLTDGVSYTLVGVLDYDHDLLGLFVDPDANDFWNPTDASNSADVTLRCLAGYWSTAARIGSGGTVTWDEVIVSQSASDVGLSEEGDNDNDDMPDAWEEANDLIVGINDSGLDPDGDNLSNLQEYLAGTDPQERDTDNDGFDDDLEIAAGTNPANNTSYPGANPEPDIIGIDSFDYPDGPINDLAGGSYWDFDNSNENDGFHGHTGSESDWDATAGTPLLAGGILATQDSSAKREYNGPVEGVQGGSDERFGAVSDAGEFEQHVVYYKFDMTRRAGATWGGASSFDFGTERYLFGVPNAINPETGTRVFAIHDLNTNNHGFSSIQPVDGRTYTVVAKLDFDNDLAALYLDPDLSLAEVSNTPVATYPHTSGNWSSAIRLGSGGSGTVEWDNLRVATTWDGLEDGPPVAVDDEATMHHLAKARLRVTANDTGSVNFGSVTIVTPPASGSAAVSSDGSILYQHTTGTPLTDSFEYQVGNVSGALTATATVTIHFTTDARFDSGFVNLPPAPPATAAGIEDAFPGLTFDSPHGFCTVPGDTRKLFVTEGDGRVFLIPDVSADPATKTLVVDVTGRTYHDNNEKAFKGIAVHPDWAANGFIYVTYNTSSGTARLSRFTCQTTPPFTASAASEQILIDQTDPGTFHNIGTCEFGPDGYLYVGLGDGGTQEDGYSNSQYIDKGLWSGILRLDVDRDAANLIPNPDSDVPRVAGGSSGEAWYRVPADNPFVGATSFNGVSVDPAEVRTELFVTGLRNPWQFSIEDLDGNGSTDEIWVGDVGRGDREEIGVYSPGENGGWSWREGTATPGGITGDRNGAQEGDATLTGPLWDYPHGGGTFQGNSVTGGFIYRGSALPDLTGKYVFADYVSGNVWSLERTLPTPTIERIGGEAAIVGLITDPSNGDILLLDRGNTGGNQGTGGIKRIATGSNDAGYPASLSQTNFFADLGDLEPNPGAVDYQPNLRFWSDHAEKSRWFLIKNTTDAVDYSRDDPWGFPEGMIWVKHFDFPTMWESFPRTIDGATVSDRRPAPGSPRRRIETRFLVRTATGVYGLSYRWNHLNAGIQSDALLADRDGESFDISITLDGSPATAPWAIPSRNNCVNCHTPEAGHALSFNTRQLNAPGAIAGSSGNFLDVLSATGYLNGMTDSPAALPRHLRPDETSYSLEARVRSYLDVNCSYCHRAGGTGGGYWDGRAHLTLANTGVVNGLPVDAPVSAGDLLVLPGDVARSILYNRAAAANGYSRMPPLATSEIDLEGVQLLADWIAGEVQAYPTYEEWRIARFGNGNSAEGAPGTDPDLDGASNRHEWMTNTDPLSSSSVWQPVARVEGNTIAHDFTGLGNRSTRLLWSNDLIHWSPWQVPGNDGIPRPPGSLQTLIGPMELDAGFFKFEIEER